MLREYARFVLCCFQIFISVFVASASSAFAADDNLWEEVAQRLEVHKYLQGEFVQNKQLSFMASPIVSAGQFTLEEKEGLRWLVTRPLRSEMRVRGDAVYLDGQPVADSGVGAFMASIMQGFMAGELLGMSNDFSASGQLAEDHWQLHLVPKSLLLRTVVEHIVLRGDVFLQSIRIVETSKTETLIEFTQVSGSSGIEPAAHNVLKVQEAASL